MKFSTRLLSSRIRHVHEAILNKDRFMLNLGLHRLGAQKLDGKAGKYFGRSVFEGVRKRLLPVSIQSFPWELNKKYLRLWDRLAEETSYEAKLRERALVLQKFVGAEFPLLLAESTSVLTGRSDVDVWISSMADGNRVEDIFISHTRLRQIGSQYFELNCSISAVFADEYFLALSAGEIEQALSLFKDKEVLVNEFITRHSLEKCLLPFRGRRKFRSRDLRIKVNRIDKEENAIGSFYTMLGVLITKFGSKRVTEELWHKKIYGSSSGILKIATELNSWR